MSSRTDRLAAKYAAKGMKSATETAREKEASRTESRSRRSAPAVADDPMAVMRRVLAEPRSQESVDRAHRHQRSLPPLG